MAWCSVISSRRRVGVRWIRSLGRFVRPPALRTVTSIRVAAVGRISHNAPAEAWLKAAPGPAARTAAMRCPSTVSTRCPTAYTPR